MAPRRLGDLPEAGNTSVSAARCCQPTVQLDA